MKLALAISVFALAACDGLARDVPIVAPTTARAKRPPPEPGAFILDEDFHADRATLSPDGSLIVGCGATGRVVVWSARDLTLLATFAPNPNGCGEATWGPTSAFFSMGDEDNFCYWSVARAEFAGCVPIEPNTEAVWSPNKSAVALLGVDRSVAIIDMVSGGRRSLRGLEAPPATKPEEEPKPAGDLASVSDSGALVAFNGPGHTLIFGLHDTPDTFEAGVVTFAPKDTLAAIESNGRLHVWDLAKHERRFDVAGTTARWSPNGARLAFRDAGGHAGVWDAATGAVSVARSVGASHIAWAGDQRIAMLDETHELWTFDLASATTRDLGRSMMDAFWPSPDGASIVVRRPIDPQRPSKHDFAISTELRVVDAATGKARTSLDIDEEIGAVGWARNDEPIALAWGPLAVASVIDLASPKPIAREIKSPPSVQRPTVEWEPGGAMRATCSGGIAFWDPRAAAPAFLAEPLDESARVETFQSADGRAFGAAVHGDVLVADARGKLVRRVHADHGALSHDGSLLATWTNGSPNLVIWNVATGARRGETILMSFVSTATWSPTADLVAASTSESDEDGKVHEETVVWDNAKPSSIRALGGDRKNPSWSPNGAILATWASSTSIALYEAASLTPIRSLSAGKSPNIVQPSAYYWSPNSALLGVSLLNTQSRRHYQYPTVGIFEVATGKLLANVRGSQRLDWTADSSEVFWGNGSQAFHQTPTGGPVLIEFRASFGYQSMLAGGRVALGFDNRIGVLVRPSDGAQLWARVAERDGTCALFVHDQEGNFDGNTLGRVRFRIGDDLRTATIDASAPTLDAHRRPGMLTAFLSSAKGEPMIQQAPPAPDPSSDLPPLY